ncbi:MAG: sarcosine oxidase subunit gamma SoxG [Gemmatimonadetes bacterium]|nr:sarcosine oxidase subunit gamma SoxG [Gemmatimonadota bacterium]
MIATRGTRIRQSPVRFDAGALERVQRDGWDIIRRYPDEGGGPWLIDLSHRSRWDLQHPEVGSQRPFGVPVPGKPGEVAISGGFVVNRMNRTQASLWHLGASDRPLMPSGIGFTETTDGHCMLAFLGSEIASVFEHLTNLDLFDRERGLPRLVQGPVLHVPCQVVALDRSAVVMTLSRGYGRTFAEAALKFARPCGLGPAGEARFDEWFAGWAATRSFDSGAIRAGDPTEPPCSS